MYAGPSDSATYRKSPLIPERVEPESPLNRTKGTVQVHTICSALQSAVPWNSRCALPFRCPGSLLSRDERSWIFIIRDSG